MKTKISCYQYQIIYHSNIKKYIIEISMKKYKNIISKFRKHQFSTFAIFHSARTYIDLINVKLYIVYLRYFSQDILQIHAV